MVVGLRQAAIVTRSSGGSHRGTAIESGSLNVLACNHFRRLEEAVSEHEADCTARTSHPRQARDSDVGRATYTPGWSPCIWDAARPGRKQLASHDWYVDGQFSCWERRQRHEQLIAACLFRP